jgi:hypothetical protein
MALIGMDLRWFWYLSLLFLDHDSWISMVIGVFAPHIRNIASKNALKAVFSGFGIMQGLIVARW